MTVTNMPAPDTEVAPPKKSRRKPLMVVGLVGALAAGYWYFMINPAGAEAAPEPGEVVKVDPIQLNLAGGHYLKIGIALQLTADAHEADGAKALDATIDLFSGRTMDQLTRPENREKLKAELEKELDDLYHGEVMGVYFTDFVTQ